MTQNWPVFGLVKESHSFEQPEKLVVYIKNVTPLQCNIKLFTRYVIRLPIQHSLVPRPSPSLPLLAWFTVLQAMGSHATGSWARAWEWGYIQHVWPLTYIHVNSCLFPMSVHYCSTHITSCSLSEPSNIRIHNLVVQPYAGWRLVTRLPLLLWFLFKAHCNHLYWSAGDHDKIYYRCSHRQLMYTCI